MRYFIQLRFDGTRYHGWQIQPHDISVQEELQRCLGTILRREIPIVGAGRTDTGVHARQMIAHFDIDDEQDCKQLTYRLNKILPRDISIDRIYPVADDMHARFSATRRTYHYYLHLRKDPFLRSYSLQTHYALDFPLMNEAATFLLQTEDFAAFCKSHTDVKTTLCNVTEAMWVEDAEDSWHFRITANRFLRNMVRAVVGTLIEVGRHRMTLEEFREVIENRKRTNAGESMPANALFLEEVVY